MSDDLDFEMEVVEEDELDELDADGTSESGTEEKIVDENATGAEKEVSRLTSDANTDQNWQKEPLEAVSGITMGSSPKSKFYNESGEGPPFLQANNEFGYRSPTADRWCSEPTKRCEKGDLLMTIRGTYVGQMNLADDDYCIGRGLAAIAPGGDLNGEYLFHYLDYIEPYVKSIAAGSTFDSVSSGDIESLEVEVPPLPEQRKIASVLYAVDQAIQKTEAIIEQAQRVKRGVIQKLLKGDAIGSDTKFEKCRIGPKIRRLPSNWQVRPLGEIAEISGGKRLPKDHGYADKRTDYPYLRVTDMKGGSIEPDELEYLREETYQEISKYTISSNDVYISIAGTIGVTGVIPEELDGANLTENAAKIHGLESVNMDYLALYLQSKLGQDEIFRMTVGSSQPKLSLFRIELIDVVLPPMDVQEEIASVVEGFRDKIASEQKTISRLYTLKKGLMQDLLTGEVRTADKAIEVLDEVAAHG